MLIKWNNLPLVTLSMTKTFFKPGDSIRGYFHFGEKSNQIKCHQVSVILQYTETINEEEITLLPGEKNSVIHVVDSFQEITLNTLETFFDFILTVDSFPQIKSSYMSVEWSLFFQFLVSPINTTKPEFFKWNFPISVIIQGYPSELDGNKGSETAEHKFII